MAFDLVQAGGYGSGKLGDVTVSTSCQLNSAAVYDSNNFILTDILVGNDGGFPTDTPFEDGLECLLVIASESLAHSPDEDDFLYLWTVAGVSTKSYSGNEIEAEIRCANDFWDVWQEHSNSGYRLCVYTIPQYRNLTLNTGIYITPAQAANYLPGVLAFKCSGTLTLNGGHIDLRNKGISFNPDYHNISSLEAGAVLDTDKYSGWENSDLLKHLPGNARDGAAFIIANKIVVADDSSRIGNPATSGVQFYRGATDSQTYNETAPRLGCRSRTRTQIGTSFLILQI